MRVAGFEPPADAHTAPVAPSGTPNETAARPLTFWWTASTAIALLSGTAWLRDPAVPYLAVCSAATVATVAQSVGRRRIGARLTAVALLGFCVLAAAGQWTLAKIEHAWPATEADIASRATVVMHDELTRLTRSLAGDATRALDAPASPAAAFSWIAPLARGPGDRGIVLYRAGTPVAWAGRISAPIDSSGSAFAVIRSSFYTVLQATVARGQDRAIATAVLHADPPADRLSDPLDADVAARTDVDSFAVSIPLLVDRQLLGPDPGTTLTVDDVPLVTLRAVTPTSDQARVSAAERVTSRGALVIAVAMLAFVIAEWRPRATMWGRRMLALATPLVALAIVPLNTFSNASRLFDPTYFFSPVGGPYTASVGALGVTGVIVLLAALAVARARFRVRPRWLALFAAVVTSIGALVALRQVAGGITPPGAAVSLLLWVGWQIALALVTTALLVGAAVAAHGGIGSLRGLPPVIPIVLAVAAAALAPVLWRVNQGWPAPYQLLWCAAALAAAFTRRTRWAVVPPAVVASLASAVIIWSTTADKRALLAEHDLAGLMTPDPMQVVLLERLAGEIASQPAPTSRADLLKMFARSDLAAAAYPVRLGLWSPEQGEWASLALARFDRDSGAIALVVETARSHATIVLTSIMGYPGVRLVLAVPGADGQVTTAVVAPPSRLFTENAFAMLVGLAADAPTSDEYSISPLELVPPRRETSVAPDTSGGAGSDSAEGGAVPPSRASAGGAAALPLDEMRRSTFGAIGWRRIGSDLHGDWLVPSNLGAVRLHVEVPLRPFDALAQRALLLVVADLLVVLVLWIVSAAGDGVLTRWVRMQGKRWARSYRTQLIVVLFMFFVVPAVLFAVWSYRRLRSDDAEERALLVWQTLRAAATGGMEELPSDADRVGTPLLLYQDGMLSAASDSIFLDVAPLGRFLRPDVELDLGLGKEVRTSHPQALAGTPVLFGYRAFEEQTILAAPARVDEIGVESRRTDLGILVLFSVVLGAAAALWLSGLAARQLARPIEALRRAAVAVAAGEREPDLAGNPPAEFEQVFGAFRRMAADFGESQRVLAWGEMARQVAHEIKNPLTPIRLGIQHLQRARAAGRTDFDTILNQNAGRILAEIDRLDRIARAFSQYGSVSTERAPAEPTDLAPVVRDVVELERLDAATGIVWELSGVSEPVVVHARADEAREVLLNVLENARLAGARRVGVRLRVIPGESEVTTAGTGAAARNGPGRALILVEDDGEGIPANVLPRIFEPRFSTRTSGSGLGLAVSRRVVEGWGGTISVQSQAGSGTRVTIVLLLARR